MGCLPHQRTKLHHGDEAAEVLHLLVLILTVHHARQIKQFGPLVVEAQQVTMLSQTHKVLHQCATSVQMWVYLVHLSPEAMFEVFLCLSQSLVVLECIQMSQHTHDTRETVDLTDIEELKCLHLKAKAGINQHQNLETKGSKAFLSFHSFYNLTEHEHFSQKSRA